MPWSQELNLGLSPQWQGPKCLGCPLLHARVSMGKNLEAGEKPGLHCAVRVSQAGSSALHQVLVFILVPHLMALLWILRDCSKWKLGVASRGKAAGWQGVPELF